MSLVKHCQQPYDLGKYPYCSQVVIPQIEFEEAGEYIVKYEHHGMSRYVLCNAEVGDNLILDHGHFPLNKEVIFKVYQDETCLDFELPVIDPCSCEESDETEIFNQFKIQMIVSVISIKEESDPIQQDENLEHCG